MAVGEIYQVRHNQQWGAGLTGETARNMVNVFFYRQKAGATANAAANLRTAFGAYFPLWAALFPPFVQYIGTDFVNIARPTDFYNHIGVSAFGEREEDSIPLAPWAALQWKSNRAFPGTRSMRKRFGCLYQSDTDGSQINETAIGTGILSNMNSFLSAVIDDGVGTEFEPVVVKRPIVLSETPVLRYVVTGGQFSGVLSTQNTRKD